MATCIHTYSLDGLLPEDIIGRRLYLVQCFSILPARQNDLLKKGAASKKCQSAFLPGESHVRALGVRVEECSLSDSEGTIDVAIEVF